MIERDLGILSPEQLETIQTLVVLPAVELVTGKDFFSTPGSELSVNRRVPLSDGAKRFIMHAVVSATNTLGMIRRYIA